MPMLTHRLLAAGSASLLAVGILAGCAPAAPTPTHTPAATQSPMFASDADALKAATDAYAAYLKMSDTIAHDGGKDPERIKPFVTGAQLAQQLRGFEVFSKDGLRSSGDTRFDTVSLQRWTQRGDGLVEVDLYMCTDVSDVRVLNSTGTDVTPGTRIDRLPIQIALQSQTTSGRLLLARSDSWSGNNFC
ncbi:MAG TPA: hypothetical protein VIJ18_16870 [Microbacteriaceae bacterium]